MLSKHSSKHSSRVKNVQQCALKWIYDENWKMRSGRVLAQIFMNERTDARTHERTDARTHGRTDTDFLENRCAIYFLLEVLRTIYLFFF